MIYEIMSYGDTEFRDRIIRNIPIEYWGNNSHWRKQLIDGIAPMERWFLIKRPYGEYVAFSAIQTSIFPPSVYRVLARLWYHPDHRNRSMKYDDRNTPAVLMLRKQIEYAVKRDAKLLFLSMEGNRHRYLQVVSEKFRHITKLNWNVAQGLYYTCLEKNLDCRQTILYHGEIERMEEMRCPN